MIRGNLEEFRSSFEELYPGVSYQVAKDDNDENACLIYVEDPSLIEDEYDYGQIEDLAFEFLDYDDIKIVHEFPENLFMD